MEGSADDLGAPESWEVADLDETMSRLMLSTSSKKDSKALTSSSELADASASASNSSSSSSSSVGADKDGVVSEDLVNQVDQFLREALQNPRERLSSELSPFFQLILFTGLDLF